MWNVGSSVGAFGFCLDPGPLRFCEHLGHCEGSSAQVREWSPQASSMVVGKVLLLLAEK